MTRAAAKRFLVCSVVCCLMCAVVLTTELNKLGSVLPSGRTSPSCKIHTIVHRIVIPQCTVKTVLSKACRGQCTSYTQYSTVINDIERVCNCCQPRGRRLGRILLRCRNPKTYNPETRVVSVFIPNGCMCRPCSVSIDNVPDVVDPLETIENPSMDFWFMHQK